MVPHYCAGFLAFTPGFAVSPKLVCTCPIFPSDRPSLLSLYYSISGEHVATILCCDFWDQQDSAAFDARGEQGMSGDKSLGDIRCTIYSKCATRKLPVLPDVLRRECRRISNKDLSAMGTLPTQLHTCVGSRSTVEAHGVISAMCRGCLHACVIFILVLAGCFACCGLLFCC